MCVYPLTSVPHVSPARDMAVLVSFGQLTAAGQTDGTHVTGHLHLGLQLQHADVVVHHGPVVARVDHDAFDMPCLHEWRWMIQIIDAKNHFPHVCALTPAHA